MAADDFDRRGGAAGFAVQGGIKDVSHMAALAAEHKVSVLDTRHFGSNASLCGTITFSPARRPAWPAALMPAKGVPSAPSEGLGF